MLSEESSLNKSPLLLFVFMQLCVSFHQEEEVFLFQFTSLFMYFTADELQEGENWGGGGVEGMNGAQVIDGCSGWHTGVLIRVTFCQSPV